MSITSQSRLVPDYVPCDHNLSRSMPPGRCPAVRAVAASPRIQRLEASSGFEPLMEVLQVGLNGPTRSARVRSVFGIAQSLSTKVRCQLYRLAGVAVTTAVIAGHRRLLVIGQERWVVEVDAVRQILRLSHRPCVCGSMGDRSSANGLSESLVGRFRSNTRAVVEGQ